MTEIEALTAPTENELNALIACLNYPTLAGQLSDNYSNGGAAEFRTLLKWNNQQVAALIGSMQAKGYGCMDDEGLDIFWLSTDAVKMLFAMKERGEWA